MYRKCQIILYLLTFFGVIRLNPRKNLLADRQYCGYQHTDDYDRSSSQISIDEYPWLAQLIYDNNSTLCSGSLISNYYVLTAGHCLHPRDKILTGVRLGDYNVKTEEDCVKYRGEMECSDPVEDFGIDDVIKHPSYNARTGENDIGLIRLSKPVTFSDYIRPICLPENNKETLRPGQLLSTSGWGTLGIGLDKTELKKRVMTILISIEKCKELYKNYSAHRPITDNHLCATESDSFTCQGDSGAPLMNVVKNQWEQVGIVSFGLRCGEDYPVVYTNVFKYLDWIKTNVRG